MKDGSHRISTLNALAKHIDPYNPYWKEVKLEECQQSMKNLIKQILREQSDTVPGVPVGSAWDSAKRKHVPQLKYLKVQKLKPHILWGMTYL